jgi:hypothetical protein
MTGQFAIDSAAKRAVNFAQTTQMQGEPPVGTGVGGFYRASSGRGGSVDALEDGNGKRSQ